MNLDKFENLLEPLKNLNLKFVIRKVLKLPLQNLTFFWHRYSSNFFVLPFTYKPGDLHTSNRDLHTRKITANNSRALLLDKDPMASATTLSHSSLSARIPSAQHTSLKDSKIWSPTFFRWSKENFPKETQVKDNIKKALRSQDLTFTEVVVKEKPEIVSVT